jgi:hypothetical protein
MMLFANDSVCFNSSILNECSLVEQHANSILVVMCVCFIFILLSDGFLVFIIFCH